MRKLVATARVVAMIILIGVGRIPVAGAGSATDDVFQPTFSNLVTAASAFATSFYNFNAQQACAADPKCGMPQDPGSGFALTAGSCCGDDNSCNMDFFDKVDDVDSALYTLYKNERTYDLIMRIQGARMTAMKGAAGMSAPGAAVVARFEIDIARAKKKFLEKFNVKTNGNIDKLNSLLLALGTIVDNYCGDKNWYQRNGLPLYLHAKIKFPK